MNLRRNIKFGLIIFIFLNISCEKNGEQNFDYINLESFDFFKLSEEVIVDSITKILNLEELSFHSTVNRWFDHHRMASFHWLKEGKLYTNSNSQSIVLWSDSLDKLTYISFYNSSSRNSSSWDIEHNVIDEYLDSLFLLLGIFTKPNEGFDISNYAMRIQTKWFDIDCNQTYNTDTIVHPCFSADIEGDTCNITYTRIPKWYINLNDIPTNYSEDQLEEKAIEFAISEYGNNVDSLTKRIGYWVIYDKLCKGYSKVFNTQRGYLNVFVDIQNSEIVFSTIL